MIEVITAGFFKKCWPNPVLGATRLVVPTAWADTDEVEVVVVFFRW
jgi:hypothetical protein